MTADLFQPAVRKSATISLCGRYRYSLTRQWADGSLLPFVMLNPSTADAEVDDPTIRRCMGFARREGAAGILVANLFALRATDPAELRRANDPVGPENGEALAGIVNRPPGWLPAQPIMPIVCAWGVHGALDGADQAFVELFAQQGAYLVCLGKTRDGHPRHPLYVRADQPFEEFP